MANQYSHLNPEFKTISNTQATTSKAWSGPTLRIINRAYLRLSKGTSSRLIIIFSHNLDGKALAWCSNLGATARKDWDTLKVSFLKHFELVSQDSQKRTSPAPSDESILQMVILASTSLQSILQGMKSIGTTLKNLNQVPVPAQRAQEKGVQRAYKTSQDLSEVKIFYLRRNSNVIANIASQPRPVTAKVFQDDNGDLWLMYFANNLYTR